MTKKVYSLKPGEKEIIDGFANKTGFFGGGGGKLVLTSERLLFTNRRKKQIKMEIPLSEILHVGVASSASIWTIALLITAFMRNAVKVTMVGGRSQRFVVNDKNRWVDLINENRQKISAQV